jgi:hypothetical protein
MYPDTPGIFVLTCGEKGRRKKKTKQTNKQKKNTAASSAHTLDEERASTGEGQYYRQWSLITLYNTFLVLRSRSAASSHSLATLARGSVRRLPDGSV